jgi:hypothetical protein
MKVRSGPTYNDCFKEESKNNTMQQPLYNQHHHTYSKDSNGILRRTERKIEDGIGDNQFGFREEKEPGMQAGC